MGTYDRYCGYCGKKLKRTINPKWEELTFRCDREGKMSEDGEYYKLWGKYHDQYAHCPLVKPSVHILSNKEVGHTFVIEETDRIDLDEVIKL